MAEETKVSEAMAEIKNANEDELRKVISDWYERTRTDGMRIGAKMIAAAVFGAIRNNLNKQRPSLRDYERCIKDIRKVIDVLLTQQNDSEVTEEVNNDGTAE